MTDSQKNIDWLKLPATIETGGYRKASDEFTFTIATPKKHQDPYINEFLAKLGSQGVIFFVVCKTSDQVDSLLRDRPAPTGVTDGVASHEILDRFLVPVDLMAQALGVDPRTVQLDAEKGILVRTGHGQYDTLASCASLRKALKAAETGVSDALSEERVKEMRVKRQEREAKLAERLGKLLNADRTRHVYESVEAAERNAILNMPKKLGPDLDMVSGTEAEVKLNDWARRHLKTFSSWESLVFLIAQPGQAQPQPVQQPKKEKKEKKKKR